MAEDTPDPVNDVQPAENGPVGDDGPSEEVAAGAMDETFGGAGDEASAPDPAGAMQATGIDLLHDVDLHVTIELGRAQMLVEDVLRLGEGSVVELDKLAGDPVDVYVNQRLVARGEVLVLNDNFCIRISEIVADLEEQAAEAASLGCSAGAGAPIPG